MQIPERRIPANLPPGPAGVWRTTLQFQRSPLKLLDQVLAAHGDICSLNLYRMPIVVLNHPDHVERVLKTHHHNYDRHGPAFVMSRNLFGNGLVNAARPEWLTQRRLLQPAFHRNRITLFGEIMADTIAETLDDWEQASSNRAPIDVRRDMSRLALRIVTRCLFMTDLGHAEIRRFMAAVGCASRELAAYMRFPLLPLSTPTPGHRRFHHALGVLDEVTYAMIRRHRDNDHNGSSLLSLVMRAQDDATGEIMDDGQLRDEVFTMLFAGHETTAGTLAWAWYLIGRHPEVELRLRDEIDRVLAGRQPTMADLAELVFTRQVIDETLRLYPPAWQSYRQALADDQIGGHDIPAGTTVFWSDYFLHRHRDFWVDPERFDPDRFAPGRRAITDQPGYYPFGAGPRICIGNGFAMAEMQFAIAMTMQRYRLVPTSTEEIAPKALLALGAARPITVHLERHGG